MSEILNTSVAKWDAPADNGQCVKLVPSAWAQGYYGKSGEPIKSLAASKPGGGRDGADFRLLRGYDAAHGIL